MKRSWATLVVAVLTILAAGGCNDYGNTFQNNTGARVASLSPSNISAGGGDFVLTLSGAGFVAKTVVQWNGQNLATTFVNSAQVTAVVPAALTAKPGTATIISLNPASGAGMNGLSNPSAFIINPPPNPIPVLTLMTPTSTAACGTSCANAGFALDLQGSNFISSSEVHWTSGAMVTTLSSPTISGGNIKVTVPGSLISTAGTASVAVYNPPAPQITPPGGVPNPSAGGGGTSSGLTFTITGATPRSAQATALGGVEQAAEETPAVSVDGRYVAYTSVQNEHTQIFLRDTCEGATSACKRSKTLISAAVDETPGNGDSHSPSMSSDGRYIAFSSVATNLLASGPAAGRNVYLRDICLGVASGCTPNTQLVSTDSNGALVGTDSILPSVSASGRFVAFVAVTPTHAANPAAGQANSVTSGSNSGLRQVFIRDTCFGVPQCTPRTTRISLRPGDGSDTAKSASPALSGNGTNIAMAAGKTATFFTRSVSVDDGVFLAIINNLR
ncbi:MAG TPA: IPT/TIG domain-containing protein [Candidatus Dormibacteraeota bacterium]|nr:IPT/TIG domain-containing protein [Candidatus Dormibacteraeota bacterium]